MISVKTELGYKLPDKIFYKQNGKYLQVKKIFANQSQLEGMTICSCEADLSNYLKLLYQMYQLNQDLLPYLEEGVEKNDIINQQSDLESEIQSTLIEQIELNKQLTIIKNAIHLKRVVYPAAQAVESLTAHMIKDITGVVIKITPGAVDINPDVVFGSLLGNGYFKYEGSWYKLSTTSTQDDDILSIQDKFGGETKVVTEIIAGNTLINYIRKELKRSVEDNLTSLDKIITQQNLIDGMIIDRQAEILSGTSTITPNTDKFLEVFYNVPTINDITPTNHNAVTLRANVALRRSNIQVGTTIDVLNPVVIPNLPSLKNKASQILGHLALAVSLPITDSGIDNPNVQIYSSSDIHEFKFTYMGRLNTGVYFDQINGTLLQTLQHSRISSNINLGILKDLSTMKLAKLTSEDVNVVPNIISEVSDKIDNIIESVKLSSGVKPITTFYDDIPVTTDPTWTGGVNYTISGTSTSPIVTTTGQFASALWKMSGYGRTGKVYFEVKTLSKSGVERGIFIGIQRTPTRKGNYHEGNYDNPNVNGGEAVSYITLSGTTIGITVDLDTSSLYINGVLRGSLSNTGPIYFGVYDGASAGNGSLQLIFDESKFTLEKPNNVTPWYGSSLSLIETDSHSRIITNTTDSLLTITPKVSLVGFNAEIVSESSNVIELLPDIVQPTAQTKYIISPVSTVINPITENIKTGAGISYKNSVLTENDSHTKIISNMSDVPVTIQEFDVVTTQAHTRVVSLIGSNIYTIEDVIATATAHPQLSTPSSDVINLMSDRKVKLTSSIIPIITNTDSPINSVVENVKVVNDPIPFTVYQQSVGEVKQFDKPIMEPSSIDIYVSSVKNIGAMSRIDPITVTVDKIPNYISTQTNMSDVLTYSDSVEYIKTIENYVVSQVTDVYSPQVFDKPTIVAEPFELFVTESKSMNTATFGDIIDVLMLPSDSYIVSKVSNNTATFGDVLDCINTPHDSDAIIDVKSVKSVSFDNSVLELSTDSVDKVIDIKSIKTITFDNSVLELSTDRMDKVIDIKAVKPITFSNNVDMTLNSEGSAFIISNGLVYSASDENGVLVVADTVDGKHYAIVRDETGILESYETDLPITSNNYFYDSVANVMYKVTSTSGFIDLVAM